MKLAKELLMECGDHKCTVENSEEPKLSEKRITLETLIAVILWVFYVIYIVLIFPSTFIPLDGLYMSLSMLTANTMVTIFYLRNTSESEHHQPHFIMWQFIILIQG